MLSCISHGSFLSYVSLSALLYLPGSAYIPFVSLREALYFSYCIHPAVDASKPPATTSDKSKPPPVLVVFTSFKDLWRVLVLSVGTK